MEGVQHDLKISHFLTAARAGRQVRFHGRPRRRR